LRVFALEENFAPPELVVRFDKATITAVVSPIPTSDRRK
jgi:hypothetical protein